MLNTRRSFLFIQNLHLCYDTVHSIVEFLTGYPIFTSFFSPVSRTLLPFWKYVLDIFFTRRLLPIFLHTRSIYVLYLTLLIRHMYNNIFIRNLYKHWILIKIIQQTRLLLNIIWSKFWLKLYGITTRLLRYKKFFNYFSTIVHYYFVCVYSFFLKKITK